MYIREKNELRNKVDNSVPEKKYICLDENENSDDDQVSSCDADEKEKREKEETLNVRKELEKFTQMMDKLVKTTQENDLKNGRPAEE